MDELGDTSLPISFSGDNTPESAKMSFRRVTPSRPAVTSLGVAALALCLIVSSSDEL